jgi:hypothetical protein
LTQQADLPDDPIDPMTLANMRESRPGEAWASVLAALLAKADE